MPLMLVIRGRGSVSVRAGLGTLEAEATGRIGAVHAAQGDHTQVQTSAHISQKEGLSSLSSDAYDCFLVLPFQAHA
jgi:hypothetical protein